MNLTSEPTQLFNARIQKGKNAGRRELLFIGAAGQKTFQVS